LIVTLFHGAINLSQDDLLDGIDPPVRVEYNVGAI
jgi:hypothetical protein